MHILTETAEWLIAFTDWMWAVIKEWIPWAGGSAIVIVIEVGHKLDFWAEPSRRVNIGVFVAGFVFSMFLSWRKEHEAVIAELKTSESLAAKLKEIDDARPHIVVRDVYTDKVSVNQNGILVCVANVLRVKLENATPHQYPNSEAKNVTATISFYDTAGKLLVAGMDARWTASRQPVGPHWQSIVPLLGMDFGIGAKRDLDIAFRDVTYTKTYGDMPSAGFVALNNDNFGFERWRKPEHLLAGERLMAKIRVSAVWVNTEFSVEFWALPQGEIGFCLRQPQ